MGIDLKGNSKGNCRSRFPSGMTNKKAMAKGGKLQAAEGEVVTQGDDEPEDRGGD